MITIDFNFKLVFILRQNIFRKNKKKRQNYDFDYNFILLIHIDFSVLQ